RADLPVHRGLFPKLGNFDPRREISHVFLCKLPGACCDDQTAQAFRPPSRVVDRNKTAARDAHQVKFVELEMIRECIEVARDAAGLHAGRRISPALAPASAIEGDATIALPRKGQCRRFPAFARAGVGMEQDDRDATTSRIGEPELYARKLRIAAGRKRFGSVPPQRRAQTSKY